MAIQIQIRRGTSTQWTTHNPILAAGELALEQDTGRFKTGNGASQWNSLPYNGFISQGNDPSNWDNNSLLGIYFVNRGSWSGTVGSPTETTSVGLLSIFTSGDMVVQKYQPSDVGTTYGSEYVRTRVSTGPWSDWTKTIGDGGSLDGGTF